MIQYKQIFDLFWNWGASQNIMLRRNEIFSHIPSRGRSTDELMEIIKESSSIEDTMAEIEEELIGKTYSQRLYELMDRRCVKASELAKISLMSRSFVYQLCSGIREPGRDVVLRLALLLRAGIPETQRMLRSAGRGALYPRIRRDAILLYALQEEMDVFATDELLAHYGETPLIET